MTPGEVVNVAASVRQRLLNLARERDESFDRLLQYYAVERFLYRLSLTPWSDRFIVKGATLLRVWQAPIARPTRDIDFLAHIDRDPETIATVVRACLAEDVEDGLEFSSETESSSIRVDGQYPGVRVVIRGHLSGARFRLQLDVGIGDDAVPDPAWVDYPTLLAMPAPRILAYDPATSVAEKLEAIVVLGEGNSRLKDFYDVWLLATNLAFDGTTLVSAVSATFRRRGTALPAEAPTALTDAFAEEEEVLAGWPRFLAKAGAGMTLELPAVLVLLRDFLLPPAAAALAGRPFESEWPPGGPWRPAGARTEV